MENEAHFRTLDETGFHNSSEHQELSSNISVLDRLYEAGNQNMSINSALQPFGISVNGSQDQGHFDMMSHSLPVHSGVGLGSYELQNSNEPLPPPQSPQFMNNDNMFRAITNNIDAFASPLRNSHIANFFAQSNSPGGTGKVKCLICPKDSQSIPLATMVRHFTSMHPTSGLIPHRRTPPVNQPVPTLESRRNFVSKHYVLINSGINKGKKKCSNCEVLYSSTTSSSILSRHLSKVHRINPKAELESTNSNINAEAQRQRITTSTRLISAPPTRERSGVKGPTPSPVWVHFAQVDILDKDGSKITVKKCHHCDKSYSANTSNSGLARHLFSVHCIRLPCFVTVPPEDPDSLKGDEIQLEECSEKQASLSKEAMESDKEEFECDMADDFSLPSVNEAKESPPQADPLASLFTMEAGSDGVSVFKKCRQCEKLFDLSSSKFTLLQHLSSHSIHLQSLQGLEERAPVAMSTEPYSSGACSKIAKLEERNYRFVQILLSKFVLSNPEPRGLLQNEYFQEIIHGFDTRIKCPSLDECKVLAVSLEGIRNLPVIPSSEANPVWSHFLEQNSNRQCLYCHFVFPNAAQSFSLSRHLGTAHPNLFPKGFPPPHRPVISEGSINAFYSLLARFLISDLRPVNLLEQELFQKFLVLLGFLEPPLSTHAITTCINNLYRDQFTKIEALLKSALSRVTLIIDLFDLKSSGSVLVVSFSFVDSGWKPRRIVASANWHAQAIDGLDLDVAADIVFFNYIRCQNMQLRVACLLVNARVRSEEFKDLLERRLRERNDTTPLLHCVSAMIDDSLLFALQDHHISSRLLRLAQPDEPSGNLLLGSDWRVLQESLSSSKLLLAEMPSARDNVAHSEWDELNFFLGRLNQVQRAAHALYDSRHVTLSEAYVALKGLSDQLFDFVDPSQPQISRLIESLSEFPSDSTEALMHLTTFLDPRFKLRVFGDRASTVLRLKKLLTAFPIQEDGTSHASISRPTFATVAASFFAPRPPFPELRVPQGLDEEFNIYLHLPPIEPQMNPLQWWLAHHLEFPKLHRIALEHLAIPASGLILLPEQNKLAAFPPQGFDLLPILALWAQNQFSQ